MFTSAPFKWRHFLPEIILIEQDHRNIKLIVKPILGFKSFNSARRTLSRIEAMNMIRKGQVEGV